MHEMKHQNCTSSIQGRELSGILLGKLAFGFEAFQKNTNKFFIYFNMVAQRRMAKPPSILDRTWIPIISTVMLSFAIN